MYLYICTCMYICIYTLMYIIFGVYYILHLMYYVLYVTCYILYVKQGCRFKEMQNPLQQYTRIQNRRQLNSIQMPLKDATLLKGPGYLFST